MNRPTHGGNIAWAAALAGCAPSLILDFSASINPLGPPKTAIAAIEQELKDLIAYPDPNYKKLRIALSHLHPTLPPDWILPGNGSAELLTWVCRELSELEETCLVTPAFRDYQRALRAFGAKVREYPLELQVEENSQVSRLNVEGLENNLPDSGLRPAGTLALSPDARSRSVLKASLFESSLLLSLTLTGTPLGQGKASSEQPSNLGLLLNNPHNPTGLLFDRESVLALIEQFALVVVDEAFMDFLPPDQQQSLISVVQDYHNLVILRSLTKFYSLPGLRLGYCVAHPDRLRRFQEWRDPWPVNVLAAAAAIAVVQDTEFQRRTWDWLAPARSQLFQGLASLPGLQPFPSAANFLLVKSERSSMWLQETLLKQNRILIRDCLSFSELGDRYFRVAVRTEAENQRLLEGLTDILNRS